MNANQLRDLVTMLELPEYLAAMPWYVPELLKSHIRETEALDAITELMSGTEWDADTTDEIARIVRDTGRRIADAIDEPCAGNFLATSELCLDCGLTLAEHESDEDEDEDDEEDTDGR